jgi:Na+-driven multidrug efflux pump
MLLLGPLWPAYGEAIRRGDGAWVNKTLRYSIVYGCGMMIVFTLVMLLFGDPILRVWTHGRVPHVSRGLIVAVGINFTLWCWITAQSVPLNGAGVIGPQLAVLGTQGILNVALAIVLARRFGVDGVAWSMAIAALASGVWGYPRLIRKHLLNLPT